MEDMDNKIVEGIISNNLIINNKGVGEINLNLKDGGTNLKVKDGVVIKDPIKVGVTSQLRIKDGGNLAKTKDGINLNNQIIVDGETNSQTIKKTGAAIVGGDFR
jgi:hypothetical protein